MIQMDEVKSHEWPLRRIYHVWMNPILVEKKFIALHILFEEIGKIKESVKVFNWMMIRSCSTYLI